MTKLHTTVLLIATTLFCAGCDDGQPAHSIEVSEKNCQPENILKIQDKQIQQEIAGKCARVGTFKPSDAKKW